MKKNTPQTNTKSTVWLSLTVLATVLLTGLEVFSDRQISSTSISSAAAGSIATTVWVTAVVCFAISVYATLVVKRFYKIIPAVCALIAIIIFGLAFFAATFSGYGSY